MKQLISLLLSAALLLCLAGCQSSDSNSAQFYYCCNPENRSYFEENSMIQAESRDLTGHRTDLHYMLGLYLAGPKDEDLVVPFSRQTKLLSVRQENETIVVELSDHTMSLSDSEFSLSCACLTMTCMDFVQCQSVTIRSGDRSATMTRDNIILKDTLPQQESTGG